MLSLHGEEVNCATRRFVVQTLIFAIVIWVRTLVTDVSVAQGLPVHWQCLSVRRFQPCNVIQSLFFSLGEGVGGT
jgi:hypothetical protein